MPHNKANLPPPPVNKEQKGGRGEGVGKQGARPANQDTGPNALHKPPPQGTRDQKNPKRKSPLKRVRKNHIGELPNCRAAELPPLMLPNS